MSVTVLNGVAVGGANSEDWDNLRELAGQVVTLVLTNGIIVYGVRIQSAEWVLGSLTAPHVKFTYRLPDAFADSAVTSDGIAFIYVWWYNTAGKVWLEPLISMGYGANHPAPVG